jgi:hypothetical protein
MVYNSLVISLHKIKRKTRKSGAGRIGKGPKENGEKGGENIRMAETGKRKCGR